jgi:hypothetical protein
LAVPQLAATDILVELHEFIKLGVTNTIFSRFRKTHTVTLPRWSSQPTLQA